MHQHLGRAAIVLVGAFATGTPWALPTVYADVDNTVTARTAHPLSDAARSSFLAAIAGSSIAVQTYETESTGAMGPTTVGVLGNGVGVTVVNSTVNGALSILQPAPGTNGPFDTFPTSGGKYLYALSDAGSTYFTVSFGQAVNGIGFNVSDVSDWAGNCGSSCASIGELRVVLTTRSGANLSYDLTPGHLPGDLVNANLGFFGIVDASDPFTSLSLRSDSSIPGGDALGIDDFTVAVTSAVPEPAAAALMLGGLPLLVALGRRRRATR